MKLSAHTDINLPQAEVFKIVSDTSLVEKAAGKKSIKVTRTQGGDAAGVGSAWTAGFSFRGKDMMAKVEMTDLTPADSLGFKTSTDGLDAPTRLDLVALSPTTTRLNLSIELAAKTMTGKLLVQSLKLAKGGLEKRFQARFEQVGKAIETYARSQA